MRELARLGLDENTIVIFTSDNGSLADKPIYGTDVPTGGSNLPLRGTKTTTWEGGQRVPAIVRWKGTITEGLVNDLLLTAMDLYPTLATLCGATVPSDRKLDGRDISDIWLGRSQSSPHNTFVYYAGNTLEAIRNHQWKLHFSKGRQDINELYDLQNDVSESHNVYAQFPEVVAELTAAADVWRAELGDARLKMKGIGVRPVGRVENPQPLTAYDPNYPYFMAEYDLDHRG